MPIITYQDALSRLQRFLGATGYGRYDEDCKLAVTLAYEGLTQSRRWTYYNGMFQFTTQAPVESTGTYVNATRKLTMATAAPTWGLVGAVLMDGKVGDIEAINTATNPSTLLMGADLNFGANYTSSTSLTLFQEHIVLPDNYREINSVAADASGTPLTRITPSEYVRKFQWGMATGEPAWYALMQDPENLGRTAMYLYPAPVAARTYRMSYYKKPRDLRFSGGENAAFDGDVTITQGTANVTGNGTGITEAMEGSVIRLTQSTSQLPTHLQGENPYTEQKIIAEYTSSTVWELDSAVSQGYAGTKFVVSDPIDIDPGMHLAFYARCRLELARLRSDTHLRDQLPLLTAEYERLFREAAENDAKSSQAKQTGRRGGGYDWTRMPRGDDNF